MGFLRTDQYVLNFNTLYYRKGVKTISEPDIFPYHESITRIIMSDSVEEIEDYAFHRLTNLKSVSFSKNLKIIGDNSFCGCKKLKKLVLPQGIELIGKSAFENCNSLKEICFPKGMRGIDRYAFANCLNLKDVSIDGSFYNILGFCAFEGTPYLQNLRRNKDLVVLNGILIDGSNCKGDVVVPDDVIEVAAGAFRFNQQLTSVTIPGTVKLVSNSAFEGCGNLKKAVLNFESGIAENLFRDCLSLDEIVFPKTIQCFYPNALTNTPWLKKQQEEGKLVVIGDFLVDGKGCKGDVRISNVKEIVAEAFMGNPDVTSIVVEDGCEVINDCAFRRCRMLKSVQLPQHMTTLGKSVFSGCENLESCRIPEGIETLGFNTFFSCYSLKTVELPESLKEIQSYAFEDCFKLKLSNLDHVKKSDRYFDIDPKEKPDTGIVLAPTLSEWPKYGYTKRKDIIKVIVPEGVTIIDKDFFNGCRGLKKVVLPESLIEIGDAAFYYCTELEYINLPKNLKKIGDGAFESTLISEITLPEGISIVPKDCFRSCKNLVRVTLSDKTSMINEKAFFGCDRLFAIHIPEGVTTIGDNAFNGSGLIDVEIPESVTTTSHSVFSRCSQLRRVKLPSSLKTVEDSFFSNCKNLKEVEMPSRLEKISCNAFLNCVDLEHLEIPSSLKIIEGYVFEGCSSLKKPKFGKGVKVDQDVFGKCFETRHRKLILHAKVTLISILIIAALVGLFSVFFPLLKAVVVTVIIIVVLLLIALGYLFALGRAFYH
ncbi:MAG: leucine-rich repeat domain-containing protein [Bacteroidales bacterium]|nr:leucine-rich repeat domain-containing protein [Candidatus Physcocola equi]